MELNGHTYRSFFLMPVVGVKFGCESPSSECKEKSRTQEFPGVSRFPGVRENAGDAAIKV